MSLKRLPLLALAIIIFACPLSAKALLLQLDTGLTNYYVDTSTNPPTMATTDGITDGFNVLDYTAHTKSLLDFSDMSVMDIGQGYVDNLMDGVNTLNTTESNEKLNLAYEMTFWWDDLAGNISNLEYTGGVLTEIVTNYYDGQINFMFDDTTPLDHIALAFGANIIDTTYQNGDPLMSFQVQNGSSQVQFNADGSFYQATYQINGYFRSMDTTAPAPQLTGDDPYHSLDDLISFQWVIGLTNGINSVGTEPQITYNSDGTMNIESLHNSRMTIDAVPEPGTIGLLGLGLLGLGIIGYRRKRTV